MMRLLITRTAGAYVEDADDFGDLRVVTDVPAPELGAAIARAGLGEAVGDHVFLDVEAFKSLASVSADQDARWPARFDAMVRFAFSKGWCDAVGRVRAHVESSTPAP